MVNLFYLDKDPKLCAQYYCDKHVNKIMIEIAQILSQVHHVISDKEPPYKFCKAISNTLAPFVWAKESVNNYKYCSDLAYYLLQEYKYRFKKSYHKSEEPIIWLRQNIPKEIKKRNTTEFKLTENVNAYSEFFNSVIASRYIYVDFKCKNDKWTLRGEPSWFNKYEKKSNIEKKMLKNKILENVKIKLPEFSKINKLRVRRYHSFLRICYDNLFQDKWDKKIKGMTNMFNPKKPLIHQLGLGHLKKVYEISNLLFDKNKLTILNNKSLKFRNKL